MIYNYMVSKLENNYSKMEEYNFKEEFISSRWRIKYRKNPKKIQAIYEGTIFI